MYNPNLTDNFLVLAGHMGITTIREERTLNMFGKRILTSEDWKKNKYYNSDLEKVKLIPPEDRE